jgi:hypothetical protein
MAKHKSNIRYKDNKDAKVGTELICPICGKTFVKRQWAQVREIDEHRMSVASKLNQYTDKELADIYRNHIYGALPYLEETENLFGRDESCHPFDIDGQFDEI